MVQRYTSRQRSIPYSREGPNEEKGGPEFECLWLNVRVGAVLTCGEHLHARIISVRGKISANITSLTGPLFIEMPIFCIPSKVGKQSERSRIVYVWYGYRFCLWSTISRLEFELFWRFGIFRLSFYACRLFFV